MKLMNEFTRITLFGDVHRIARTVGSARHERRRLA